MESYRDRKDSRLRRTLALYAHDAEKHRILDQIWRALTLVQGDRGAVVWLDDYGPGLPHAYALLDLASDRPRRLFSPAPFAGAWDVGVPGLLDIPDAWEKLGKDGAGIRSVCTVALGSDGPRSWFLCLDSLTPRTSLSTSVAGDLMFIAGECASLLLHRDLEDAGILRSGQIGKREERFAGWPVLGDIEGLKGDEAASATIATRFLVARLIRTLVDDDLVVDSQGLRHQLDGVRRELESHTQGGSERKMWERVLVAVDEEDHRELLSAVLEWGGEVEALGHLSGAHELHGMSYQLAVAEGVVGVAVDAARFLGRVSRKLARWDDAVHWYGVARRVAEEVGSRRKLALVLDGMGNAYRDRGNLPRAREVLGEVLVLGREEGDRHALAIAHHDLMTVEKLAGELDTAIHHGWEAAKFYEAREGTLKAFFDLAGVLKERGELSAAWDAYSVVAAQVGSYDYRILSMDGMAHIAALRGDEERYEGLRAQVDGLDWGEASPVVQAQILLYRGLSLQALGHLEEAESWLARALASAEKHGLSQLIFEAEKAQGQERPPSGHTRPVGLKRLPDLDPSPEILEVRRGLQEMRAEVVGAVGAL